MRSIFRCPTLPVAWLFVATVAVAGAVRPAAAERWSMPGCSTPSRRSMRPGCARPLNAEPTRRRRSPTAPRRSTGRSMSDDAGVVELLLEAGADAAATNRYGVAPIALACVNGNAAIARLLLDAGVDPNTTLAEGETALMTAARTGAGDVVELLLDHGADVNAAEAWRGQTALMWAAAEGHAHLVPTLLDHGADLRARSAQGWTALLFAVREGEIGVVQTLLEAGVDVEESLPVLQERRRGGTSAEAEATGLNAFLLGGRERPLRARRPARRPGCRRQRGFPGLVGAPSGVVGAQGGYRRQQQPRSEGLRRHDEPGVREKDCRRRRRPERPRQDPPAGRHHPPELHRRHAVPPRRAHRRRAVDAPAGRTGRRPPVAERGRHHARHGGRPASARRHPARTRAPSPRCSRRCRWPWSWAAT